MSIKSFIIILVLGVVVNEIALYVDAFVRNSIVAGQGGFPLRFTSAALFGRADTNYLALFMDIALWFLVIWVIWKIMQKLVQR